MPFDLAIDFKVGGDLVFTGNRDLQGVIGDDQIKQRIMTRLFIERPWDQDPTEGNLGSRLNDLLHYPRDRALREADLIVREALEPMEDVNVVSVTTEPETDQRKIRVKIEYSVINVTDPRPIESAIESVEVTVP